MALVRKKQDDKYLKVLRELVAQSGNKQCFDCNQKGPTYVNMTIGSFVCTRCSGVLRGLTPPHRVKSISMATFTTEEVDFMKEHGNVLCAKTWLGLWDPKRVHTQDQRELIIEKYERKRYYLEPASPLKSIANTTQLVSQSAKPQTSDITSLTNGNGDNGLSNGFLGTLTNGRSQNSFTKNAFDHQTNNENNNVFASDGDFVADFNSANIFNALNGKSATQPLNVKQTNYVNGANHTNHFDKLANGHGAKNECNGFATNGTNGGAGENFADFEHNTIYNAAAIENLQNSYVNYFGHSTSNNSNNNITNINNQKNNAQTNNANTSTQWTVWQQFPWPYIQPEQNRWSLPMSLSSTSNSLKSSATFNSNSSISSTPSVDRYAALKDLDEQLREIKEKETQNTQNTSTHTANPFNPLAQNMNAPQPNPFQATASPMSWPNDQHANGPTQPMYPITNGNGSFNAFTMNGNGFTNNGNGQQFHQMSNEFPVKNPFVAPVLNATTNPFL